MTTSGRSNRAEYFKQYREKNKDRINAYRRDWNKKNPDKVKQYQETYWNKKAEAQQEGGN